ncbi:MAG: biotin--[acetyl-CoA-carboxylase] ligase [Oscillospiraceae bacterium]|nr:biotin--[acetyl-CoA-carboxylase] ligase [Oscillospiraceae bacterium]
MSRALGITRAAVWKSIESLRQDGYEIDSLPNRGYRLHHSPDRLSVGELAWRLSDGPIGRELICLDQVDSTNSELKRRAAEGAQEGLVVLADQQTGGRGRLGRSFSSPEGKGLYLSALLSPALPPSDVVNLTAWVAVAVCDAIERAAGVRPGIKWTNDIILNQKKLCGILTEMSMEAESDTLQYVVAGIGINVSQDESDFGDLTSVATSLKLGTGLSVPRAELAAAVINALNEMYQDFPRNKAAYLSRYRTDCLSVGREVRLLRGNHSEPVFAQSVDDDFRLVVRYPDGRLETVSAGEVSVRGLLGYI